jgi:cytohesin
MMAPLFRLRVFVSGLAIGLGLLLGVSAESAGARSIAVQQRGTAQSPPPQRRLGPLNQAAAQNDLQAARDLLDAGANPNAKDDYGEPPIFRATSLEMITLLIDRGADINLFDDVLHTTPLMRAVGRGRSDLVMWLLQKGADPRLRGPREGRDAPDPRTALAMAGDNCLSIEATEALIKAGASTPADLGEALYSAAFTACMDLARLFLDRGADVNWRNSFRNTSLHAAAIWGKADVIQLLLAHGADPSLKNREGRTPRAETNRRDLRQMLEEAERKKRGR